MVNATQHKGENDIEKGFSPLKISISWHFLEIKSEVLTRGDLFSDALRLGEKTSGRREMTPPRVCLCVFD